MPCDEDAIAILAVRSRGREQSRVAWGRTLHGGSSKSQSQALLKFKGLFGERKYFKVLITGLCEGVCGRAYRELVL